MDRAAHWDKVYSNNEPDKLTWHQSEPRSSLVLFESLGLASDAEVIDVGAGCSSLGEALLARGFKRLTLLDLSAKALARLRAKLGTAAAGITWIAASAEEAKLPAARYDLWHDRAVFHFLVEPAERAAYLKQLRRALKPGGHAIFGVFSPNGPLMCSNLPVQRYSLDDLQAELGQDFALKLNFLETHYTPNLERQEFLFAVFKKA